MNEAETCSVLVEPKLKAAGWETRPYQVASQPMIAPGRIVPMGQRGRHEPQERPDYLIGPEQMTKAVEQMQALLYEA